MNLLLTLRTLEPLHVGTGQGVGAIDLPMMREASTGWPLIPGSSVKGALRDAYEGAWGVDDANIAAIFGKEGAPETGRAGSLCPADLFTVLMPVPSVWGGFAWATCPLALRRATELAELAGVALAEAPQVADGKALVAVTNGLDRNGKALLQDLEIPVEGSADLKAVAHSIAPLCGIDAEELTRQIILVDNATFKYLTRSAAQVTTKVTLQKGKRTAKKGGLRTEESLPVDAMMLGLIRFQRIGASDPAETGKIFAGGLPTVMQFGGKSTTGHGLCRLFLNGGGAK